MKHLEERFKSMTLSPPNNSSENNLDSTNPQSISNLVVNSNFSQSNSNSNPPNFPTTQNSQDNQSTNQSQFDNTPNKPPNNSTSVQNTPDIQITNQPQSDKLQNDSINPQNSMKLPILSPTFNSSHFISPSDANLSSTDSHLSSQLSIENEIDKMTKNATTSETQQTMQPNEVGVPESTWDRWMSKLTPHDLIFESFTSKNQNEKNKFRVVDDFGEFVFDFLAPLGKGVSGAVYLVKVLNCQRDVSLIGSLYAIKIYKSDQVSTSQGTNEILMIPFVQRISGTSNNKKRSTFPSMCMKLQIKGHIAMLMSVYGPTLFQIIAMRNYVGLPLPAIRSIMSHILQGLAELESRGVVHADIKPENILMLLPHNLKNSFPSLPEIIPKNNSSFMSGSNPRRMSLGASSNASGIHSFNDYTARISLITNSFVNDDYDSSPFDVVLVDWSSSSIGYSQQSPYVQSRYYRAPEVLLRIPGKFGPSADVWSLGCVAVELFLGSPLFPGGDELDMLRQIQLKLGVMPQSLIRKIGDNSPAKHSDEWKIDPSMYMPGNFEMFLRERSGRDDFDFLAFINILRLMLQLNPDARITASSAMLHPFITGVTSQQHQPMRAISRRDSTASFSSSSLANAPPGALSDAAGEYVATNQLTPNHSRSRSRTFRKRSQSSKMKGIFDDTSSEF